MAQHPIASLALTAFLAFGLAACGDGGGSGGGGGATAAGSAVAGGHLQGGTATNAAQWQTALAAMAQTPSPDPVRLESPAIAAWNALLRRSWPGLVPMIQAAVQNGLQTQLASAASGSITVTGIRDLSIRVDDPPQLDATAPAPTQSLVASIPGRPGSWEISFTVDFTYDVSVFGYTVPVAADVEVSVADLQITQPIAFDLADPANVTISGPGTPSLQMRLGIGSSTPLVGSVLGALNGLLDPLVRVALLLVTGEVQQQVGLVLQQLPQGPAWGLGGPALAAVAGALPLEPLAVQISDDIQQFHMPFDHVFPTTFDQPHQGGSAVSHSGHGDSAIWTGHYLASEAYRFDVTGDARALAGATRAVSGIGLLLDVAGQGGGLLSRAAIPSGHPRVADMSASGRFIGYVNGIAYDAKEIISRDQYIGVMLGLGQTHHRVPALRARTGALIDRVVGYFESTQWIAYRADHQTVSVTFATTPAVILSFTKLGALVDAAKWQATHESYHDFADILWLMAWFSARDVHESYYKFNLSHSSLVSLFELETDAGLYREYVKTLRMTRTAVGHHQNAWFDAIYGAAVPAEAQAMGADVQVELERWSLRPRRGFTVTNSANPAIATGTVASTLPNTTGGPAGGYVTAPRIRTVALHPLPIELRPPTDFLWQRDPFRLDGGEPPTYQGPGIDLALPYWFARSHGLLP